MSEFTEKDYTYRKASTRQAWEVGRAMHNYPQATIFRYTWTEGKPHLGIEPTKTDAVGFPLIINVNYVAVINTELRNLSGFNVGEAVYMTTFDATFQDDDIIALEGERYRIFSNEYDTATGANRLVILPTLEETT